MALLVCCACERRRIVTPIRRDRYVCSNCGAQPALVVRQKVSWTSWSERDGVARLDAMRETYAGLCRIAEFKEYNQKWPLPKFKSLFGIWPPYEFGELPSSPPSQALLKWIQKSNEAWKQAKREEEKKAPVFDPGPVDEEEAQDLPCSIFMTADDWNVKL